MEKHLFIIWEKALFKKDEITDNIKHNFEVIFESFYCWDKKTFSDDISNFYGTNLKNSKSKIKHCGNGPFYLIVVLDKNPRYKIRNTSNGFCYVNSNVFDKKLEFRKMVGGGHKIHATNNSNEYEIDIKKLFKNNWNDLKNIDISKDLKIKKQNDGRWKSLEDVFKFINETVEYVILRNFENLEGLIKNDINQHPDIDILCEDTQKLANLIGAIKTSSIKYRKQYYLLIDNKKIFFDLRGVNENYYCYPFSKKILQDRLKKNYFYVPNNEDFHYSLMYHAIIHKQQISLDYLNKLLEISKPKGNVLNFNTYFFEKLTSFLQKMNFKIVEPLDLSVYFNEPLIKKFYPIEISIARKKYKLFLRCKYFIFKHLKKILGERNSKKLYGFFIKP